MASHRQITRGIITAIITLIALYILLCYLDCNTSTNPKHENFVDNTISSTGVTNNNNLELINISIMDTLFPGLNYPVPLSADNIYHYNNLDTQLTIRFAINNASDILNNVLITFSDVRSVKPDVRWTSSRWQALPTPTQDNTSTQIFEIKQYLEPDTTYRMHVLINGSKLTGDIVKTPIKIGGQHFRALGVEVQSVDRDTDPTHGGPLDGNMGLALLVNASDTSVGKGTNLDTLTIPGGNIQLGQIQMIPYNQALFHLRVPDIRIFHQLVQRHVTKLSGDLPVKDVDRILAGILEYIPWKINASVVELTKDGSRPYTEEEMAARDNRQLPRVRIEAGNPSVCVNPNQSPTGPCPIRLIGVQPGRYYRVTVQVVFNQLDTTNNYRRTLPLVFTFQAIDVTGSASLVSDNTSIGIVDAIQSVGIKLDDFKKRQIEQDRRLDELDKMYEGVNLV